MTHHQPITAPQIPEASMPDLPQRPEAPPPGARWSKAVGRLEPRDRVALSLLLRPDDQASTR